MSASKPKFSRFPALVDLRKAAHFEIAFTAAIAAERGRRRDGTSVIGKVSSFAEMISTNKNHCWRTVRGWRSSQSPSGAVQVTKQADGSDRFDIAGGKSIKFPTWALTSGLLSRVAIVALLGLCSGLQFKDPSRAVPMTRRSLYNRTGLADKSISKALDELIEAGVITKVNRWNHEGRRIANAYVINWEQGARESHMAGARESGMGTARESTNTSEDLFSEDYSSNPPPPSTNTGPSACSNRGEQKLTTDKPTDDPSDALVEALCRQQGVWAPRLERARITNRDRRKLAELLQGVEPEQAAQALEAATTSYSLHNVWRPVGVLASRLEQVLDDTSMLAPPQPTLNSRQMQLRSNLAGEIAAGEREGTLSDWQDLIDELA